MKLLAVLIVFVALIACDEATSQKHTESAHLRYVPTTDAERKAVASHIETILQGRPATLSGDDPDWDDAVRELYDQARQTHCRPTMWETRINSSYTGKWWYVDEADTK